MSSAVPQVISSRDEQKARILKQVEYYFGDANYLKDRYIQRETAANRGWLSIEKMATTFNKMKEFTDMALIVEALRASPELLQVSEDGKMIRRRTPAVKNGPRFDNSIYVKGFPEGDESVTGEVEALFAQFGEIKAVQPRKEESGKFKGSFFIEFGTREAAVKAADAQLKWRDQDLLLMLKETFVLMKAVEKDIPTKDLFKKAKAKGDGSTEAPAKVEVKAEPIDNVLISVSGLPEEVDVREFKELIQQNGFPVKFVRFNDENKSQAVMELREPCADKLVEKMSGEPLDFANTKVALAAVSDEQKTWFWNEKTKELQAQFDRNAARNASRGRGRGRGGMRNGHRHNTSDGRKRKADEPLNGNHDAKQAKTTDTQVE